jgi:hypothetical protein
MCNCEKRPGAIVDPQYWDRSFHFIGISQSLRYFEPLDPTRLAPSLSHSILLYRCVECEQGWYIESAPEELAEPLFAIKLESLAPPSVDDVRAAKESLSVIAHTGVLRLLAARPLGAQTDV